MPRNGNGVYSLPQPPFVSGTVISSSAVNSDFSDIAAALTGSLPTNGSTGMTGQLKVADGSTIAPAYTFSNETNTGFSRVSAGVIGIDILGTQVGTISASGIVAPVQATVPIGTVTDFAGATAPSQWYLCYGQAVSRTTYSALFAVIGTTYGSGDGVTTFNLPDLRGIVTAGVDNMGGSAASRLTTAYFGTSPDVLGAEGGVQDETLTLAQLPTGITSSNAAQAITVVSTGSNLIPTDTTESSRPSSGGSILTIDAASGGGGIGSVTSTGNNAIAVTSNNTGGSNVPIIQPTMVLNKIIYAGA